MRVLVACEYSARVRDEFRARGHDAYSVDILPTEGDPRWHMRGDALDAIRAWRWDLLIAFPPCTYLTNSNAWRWNAIREQREEALGFVRRIMEADVPRIAVENPAGAIGTQIRKADQYVQPWWFGDPFQKATGLWLKNLPKLRPEVTEKPAEVRPWAQAGYGPRDPVTGRRTSKGPAGGAVRSAHERSRTFRGIARAMAEQWGGGLDLDLPYSEQCAIRQP